MQGFGGTGGAAPPLTPPPPHFQGNRRAAAASKAHNTAFMARGMLQLASVLKADPRAVMDVPAVRALNARVAGAGPALEQGAPSTRKRSNAIEASGEQPSPKKAASAKTNTRAEPVTGSERMLGYQGRAPELCKRWKIGWG